MIYLKKFQIIGKELLPKVKGVYITSKELGYPHFFTKHNFQGSIFGPDMNWLDPSLFHMF